VPKVDLAILALSTGGRVGIDGPIATGGVPRTDGLMASGGVIASGGTTSRGGAAGSGGVVASGGTSGGTGGSPGFCGDEKAGAGEQCDLGAENAESAAIVVTQGGVSFAAVPFIQAGTGADFYAYSSASAHTGYEAPGMSRILVYLDKSTRVLSLIVFHGVDQDSTGVEQPASTVQFLFSGLPDSTAIGISDDSNELIMTSSTTATGLWNFTNNSDGGVLHGFPLPGDWTITVDPYFIKGDWKWTWLEPDGSEVYLDLTQPLTIQARSKHGECRTDCTVPQCGDGIWDAGEVCDDGQPSKSGCSLNCMSFN
jgi:cysteine-rich repeat protein